MKKPFYQDLGDLDENSRIDKIGHYITAHKKVVGFIVDKGEECEGKGDRYIKKLLEKFPEVKFIERADGPVKNSEIIIVGPKGD